MNKYINIILYVFFGILISKYNLGLTFLIPIAIYYGMRNFKNIILLYLVITITIYFKVTTMSFSLLVFSASFILYRLSIAKVEKVYYNVIYCLVINVATFGIEYKFENVGLLLFYSVLSSLILLYYYFNQESSLQQNSALTGISYTELFNSIVSVVGATTLMISNFNVSLYVAIYFSIYFTSSRQFGKSMTFIVLSAFGLRYFFEINESYLIFLIAPLYLFPKLTSTVMLFSLSIFMIIYQPNVIPREILQIIMGVGLFFEIFRFSLINDQSEKQFISGIYENVFEVVKNDTVSFASFLDLVNKEMSFSTEYNSKVSEVIKLLYKNHCEGCAIKKDCLQKNKAKIYYYYKSLIKPKGEDLELCPNHREMKRTALTLVNKYNITGENSKNEVLSIITSGMSTILKQYNTDHAFKEEIDYSSLYKIKTDMIEYGLDVSLFNVRSAFQDSLLLEVGLNDVDFKTISSAVEKISSHHLGMEVSAIYQKNSKGRVYFHIVPKVNFDVTYGFGAIASLGNNVCGDNYLVKQLSNSKIVAAISDGMGKGVNANMHSVQTLKLLDEITNMNIMPETALQILNTLLYIQDYQEIYSTLDFLEINRQSGEGTFFKAGGTTTYLFRKGGHVQKIENENLPFGVEEMIDIKKLQLEDNDLIIMASDGVFECIQNKRELEEYIEGIKDLEPQKLIYEVLNYTRYSETTTKDDMSIVALKVKACMN